MEQASRHDLAQHTREWPLAGTAAFALIWIAARACIQSITIDEADTYLAYVGTPAATHWLPSSNNHVLNSMLMRLFTSVFGVSNFTMRLPALLGAVLYVGAVYLLVRLLARRALPAWGLMACLVLNPMVMDYLVAARGYSLALGLLMSAIAVAARDRAAESDPRRTCSIVSVLLALSFAANFSFALADAVTLAGIAGWCLPAKRTAREYWRIAVAATVPGLLVSLYLTGTILAHWVRNDLRWGATTFAWSLQSIGEQCFYKLSPYLVNQPLYDFLSRYADVCLPLLGLACLWRLLVLLRERNRAHDGRTQWLVRLGLLACCGAVLTYALHAVLVWSFHVLWPRGRTGLFVPPLCTLAVGALAALPSPSKVGAASQRAIAGLLAATGCYFILCLRLTWFTEWYWNANADRLYQVVAHYNHARDVRSIGTNWRYVAVLNYYRTISGQETLEPIQLERPIPPGRPLYVLFPADDREFASREGLKVVYHDPLSDAWVAVRPELDGGTQRNGVPAY